VIKDKKRMMIDEQRTFADDQQAITKVRPNYRQVTTEGDQMTTAEEGPLSDDRQNTVNQ
jgi:hypothetical protein